ncbi:PQQ-dependent sugar dehydrogenase [Ferruginibacter sp.]
MKKKLILMSKTCCLLYFFICAQHITAQTSFTKRTVASGFNSAWEIVYGPNDSLWVTENKAYTISRVSIATGQKTALIDLRATDPSINFTSGSGTQPQGGLMGLAIHPNLFSTDEAVRNAAPWVYAAYVYNRGACPGTNTSCVFTTKIVRFEYDGDALINPVTIINSIPGSSDHNSGRLVISPVIEPGADADHTQYRLYYTVGDMGAGQFLNTTRTENAQNVNVMEGKVLRLNTQIDNDGGADNWVPNDNPFYNSLAITPQDYVFSSGHRNPQGLAWGNVNGTNFLYSSEQMDRTDDEINIIESGKNYGWDKVSGYCDDNVNGYRIGQNNSVDEDAFCTANIGVHKEPIFTLFTATAAEMPALMAESNNNLWPTVACSSIDFYGQNIIPGWSASLLITPLKKNMIYRVKLNAAGNGITGDTVSYFRGDGNRIRRIITSPDGFKFYVARDVGASSNGGSIMEYAYTGPLLAINDNSDKPTVVKNLVKIYPNPVSNVLNVQAKKEMRKPLLGQLYDMNGKLVNATTSYKNNFSINISSLSKGIYTFKLYNAFDVEMQIEKIIKF